MTSPIDSDAAHEARRLHALHELGVLDTPLDSTLDQLAELASWTFNVPQVCVALADGDRLWFAATHGVVEPEISRWPDLGVTAALSHGFAVFANVHEDPPAHLHPWVAGELGVRWVASAALTTPEGYHVGALMLMDSQQRELSAHESRMLSAMARLAMDHVLLKSTVQRSWQRHQELEQAHGWLIESAAMDALTQVANRRALMAFLEKTQALARRERQPLVVLLFDVLDFKRINEMHGDSVGDHVLIEMATRLATSARGSELVGRMSGDEFMAILYPCTPEQGRLAGERYALAVESAPVGVGASGGETIALQVAVGLCAMESGEPLSPDEIYRRTAHALDASKLRRQGKGAA